MSKMRFWARARRRVGRDLLPYYYEARNRFTGKPIVGSSTISVSMTTHGHRISSVHLVVESIAAGRVKPGRVILWLDNDEALETRSPQLRRLEKRGLEIRRSENFGPHTKYYPYVQSIATHDSPLVTADDDILYPRRWLHDLSVAHDRDPSAVIGHRVYRIALNGTELAPYDEWSACDTTASSFANLATGVSGVIYPPSMLNAIRAAGNQFASTIVRSNDDLWLHAIAIRSGHLVRQVSSSSRHFALILRGQDIALHRSNVAERVNDTIIDFLYTDDDIDLIRLGLR